MRTGFHTSIIVLLLMAAAACEKAEPELLTGDILGVVDLFDQDQYVLEDLSGVRVRLQSDAFLAETVTNSAGEFAFPDMDYGNYSFYAEKENFVASFYEDVQFHHLGGYNPTRISRTLHAVPDFGLEIDSVHLQYGDFYLWLRFTDWNGYPKNWYFFRCYFSGSPEVSKDAFHTHSQGWIYGPWIANDRYEARLENYLVDDIVSDSIYLRIYPEALNQGLYTYNPQALGKASEVLAVKNPFIE